MCGWNIHSSLPERQNFSTLLVSFRPEMDLLSPRTIFFFFGPKYQENVQPLSVSLTLYFLYFHAVKTEVNGANSKVTGAALFASHQRQRLLFSKGRKGASLYWLSFHYPVFSSTAVSFRVAFSVAKCDSPVSLFYTKVWHEKFLLLSFLV